MGITLIVLSFIVVIALSFGFLCLVATISCIKQGDYKSAFWCFLQLVLVHHVLEFIIPYIVTKGFQ